MDSTICFFGFPDRVKDGTMSDDSNWSVDYPTSNLQNDKVASKATSTATEAYFICTFATDKKIQAVALTDFSMSIDATIKIEFLNASDVAQTGSMSVAQDMFPSGLFYGTSDADKAEELSNEIPSIYVFSVDSPVTCQKVKVTISDNSTFSISRFIACPIFQPTRGISVGFRYNFNDLTEYEESSSGRRFHGGTRIRREFNGSIDFLTNTEAYKRAMSMLKRIGSSTPILFCRNPDDDNDQMPRDTFWGYLYATAGVSRSDLSVNALSFNIEEVE